MLGKCLAITSRQTVRVAVPFLKFDSFLNHHFRENQECYALDKEEKCEQNDWILIRKLPEKYSLKVEYVVDRIVYKSGDIVDPITGLKSAGYVYKIDQSSSEEKN